jgi:hypothetical protein
VQKKRARETHFFKAPTAGAKKKTAIEMERKRNIISESEKVSHKSAAHLHIFLFISTKRNFFSPPQANFFIAASFKMTRRAKKLFAVAEIKLFYYISHHKRARESK